MSHREYKKALREAASTSPEVRERLIVATEAEIGRLAARLQGPLPAPGDRLAARERQGWAQRREALERQATELKALRRPGDYPDPPPAA
jgi:hypothetical protein